MSRGGPGLCSGRSVLWLTAHGSRTMQHDTKKRLQILRRTAAAFLFFVVANGAAASALSAKIAPDLAAALTAPSVNGVTWARDTASGRMVKVLVIAEAATDPDLVNLRRAILNAGGSVYYRYISVSGVSAVLPAARVNE